MLSLFQLLKYDWNVFYTALNSLNPKLHILETRWKNKFYKYVEFYIDKMYRILCVQHAKWIFKFKFVLALYPLIHSIRWRYRKERGRGPGKKSLLYSQVLERQSLVARGGHKWRGHPGRGHNQIGGEERERGGWACGPVLLLEFKGEHTAQGERWDLTGRFECSAVTGGQGKKGHWWQWPAFTLVPLGTMVGCSHPVCGNVQAAGEYGALKFTA